jgi:hypothetical protein
MKSTVNQRFIELISALKKSRKEFCSETNIPYPTLLNIIGDRGIKPSFEVFEKVLFTYDKINAEWLIKGEGEMFKSEQIAITPNETWKDQMLEEVRAIKEKMQDELDYFKAALKAEQLANAELRAMLGKPIVSRRFYPSVLMQKFGALKPVKIFAH